MMLQEWWLIVIITVAPGTTEWHVVQKEPSYQTCNARAKKYNDEFPKIAKVSPYACMWYNNPEYPI